MKVFTTQLFQIAQNENARLDHRLHAYGLRPICFQYEKFGRVLKSISNGEDIGKEFYAYDESDLIYPTVNNLKKTGFDFSNLTFLDEDTKTNKRIDDGDLLISRSGTVGLSQIWDCKKIQQILGRSVEAVPSGYLIVVTLDSSKVNPKFAQYYLNSSLMTEYFYVFGVGKTQKNISQADVLNIPFPKASRSTQDEAIVRIDPIVREIENLQLQINGPLEVIDRVFANEFRIDLVKFEQLKRLRTFDLNFETFADNQDLRFSTKFHHPAGKFIESELRKVTEKSIKHFLAEDIVLGAGISPADFEERGEHYYISMASVKNFRLETDESQLVSELYAEKNRNKSVKIGDIIMTRSGVAIGKFALITDDVKGIFADFTMRIRLENVSNKFAYYYFRSSFFQYLIFTHKKGLQNQNIFPRQIRDMPMPDIALQKQNEIALEIDDELAKQGVIYQRIEQKRRDIDEIISSAVQKN